MNHAMKACLLTVGLGIAFLSANSDAAMVAYGSAASAPARCQAFTPGPSNTVRNRIVGSENIGSPIAVACSFETEFSAVSSNITAVEMFFSNNGTAASSVNCTMLNGWQGAAGAVAVNKVVNLPVGNQTASVSFDASDTPDTTDTDLGFLLVGVNCTLPTNGVINDTYAYWADENGV